MLTANQAIVIQKITSLMKARAAVIVALIMEEALVMRNVRAI